MLINEQIGINMPKPDIVIEPENVKHHIYATSGGGGNHVRWLCLLDNQFELHGLLKSHNSNPLPAIKSKAEKVDFLLTVIYSYARTWNNWIETEAINREILNNIIYFCHTTNVHIPWMKNTSIKKLSIVVDLDIAVEHYRKFKPRLNEYCDDEAGFRADIGKYDNLFKASPFNVSGDALFQPNLSKETYEDIISTLGLDDNYYEANIIHQRWYDLISNQLTSADIS